MSQAHARGRGVSAKTKKAVFESDDGDFGGQNGNGVKKGGVRANGGMTKRKAGKIYIIIYLLSCDGWSAGLLIFSPP